MEQELAHQRLHNEQQQRVLQQVKQAQIQEQAQIEQVRQILSQQVFLNEALSEHSQRSAEQYEQDEQRCEELEAANNPDQGDIPSESPPRSPIPPESSPPPGSPSPPRSPLFSAHESPPPHRSPPPPGSLSPHRSPPPPGSPPPPLPPAGRPYHEPVELHSLGPMNVQCPHCHALHFMTEKLTQSSCCNSCFGMCCLQGQVDLPHIQPWPPVLQNLYNDPQDHVEFKKKHLSIQQCLGLHFTWSYCGSNNCSGHWTLFFSYSWSFASPYGLSLAS